MRKHRQKLVGIAWFIFVIAMMTGIFSASFFLLAFVYQAIHWRPAEWIGQVLTAMFGLLLAGLLIGGAGRIARRLGWVPERNVFSEIIEALEKIARGDFDIRVSDEFEDNEMVGKLATSVNAMAKELSQMEKMRQEFISNVSHEIQSPLTSIRGFAQALKDDHLSVEQRDHYLGIIEEESTRLSRITENLLRLAALESDRVKFEPVTYRLDRQIRSLVLVCEPQWREKGLDMDISLAEVEVTADEDLLSQVWINLIHNSIKFTNPGGRVSVCLRKPGERIEFEIADNGLGISEADQEHIFERFFKADPARTRSNEGSGLGLSIARKIVEMHHGTISVRSQVGTGTTFTVTLPA